QLLTGGLDDERIVRREHYAWKVGVERITGAWIERLITQPRSISVFGARRGLRDAETRRGEKGGRGEGEEGRRRGAGGGGGETRGGETRRRGDGIEEEPKQRQAVAMIKAVVCDRVMSVVEY